VKPSWPEAAAQSCPSTTLLFDDDQRFWIVGFHTKRRGAMFAGGGVDWYFNGLLGLRQFAPTINA
jgi:hypothetical protein